jgi:hypothetical protein
VIVAALLAAAAPYDLFAFGIETRASTFVYRSAWLRAFRCWLREHPHGHHGAFVVALGFCVCCC